VQDETEVGSDLRRSTEPRRRGLGKGLGAILSAPSPSVDDRVLHDPLTFLPNRVVLDEKLRDAIAECHQNGAPIGVFFIALDRFSHVNELFGHHAGDDLLNDVAARLSASRRRIDTVARFGGDEFVVVCPYVGSGDDASRIAQQILEDVGRPTSVDGVEHQVTASVGVVVTSGGGSTDVGLTHVGPPVERTTGRGSSDRPEMVLGNAALAMRRAKEEGGASWKLFEPAMREDAAARHRSRQGLRAAMENGDLVLVFEPIVDLTTGEIIGEAALVRSGPAAAPASGSADPVAGADDPDNLDDPAADSSWDLLDEADDAGLAAPIGRWVLDTALSGLAPRVAGSDLPDDFRLWIKVSPGQVTEPAYVDSVDELTAKHRVPASMLGLDIREAQGVGFPAVAAALDALSERGIVVALDDLGAGPSNLDWLQQLPITGLKLAPQVVDSLESDDEGRGAAMVRGLISLGRALGFSVVAQGVRTESQVVALQGLGCELAQGPLFEPYAGHAVDAGHPAEDDHAPPENRATEPEALWATPGPDVGSGPASPFVDP
jgi:diguanylate cyclase (GGDEF)-like protein